MLVMAPLAGTIVRRSGAKLPLFVGTVILAVGFCYFYAFHATLPQIVIGVLISFVGVAFILVTTVNIILQSVEQTQTGIATAVNVIFRTVGGVVGPIIAGVFLAQYTTHSSRSQPLGDL